MLLKWVNSSGSKKEVKRVVTNEAYWKLSLFVSFSMNGLRYFEYMVLRSGKIMNSLLSRNSV